jgi:hypothetical protein
MRPIPKRFVPVVLAQLPGVDPPRRWGVGRSYLNWPQMKIATALVLLGCCRTCRLWGKHPTLGYQPCNDLQTPQLPNKPMCDSTLAVIDAVRPCVDPLPRRARCERRRWGQDLPSPSPRCALV